LWLGLQSACEQGEGWSSAQNLSAKNYAVSPQNAVFDSDPPSEPTPVQ